MKYVFAAVKTELRDCSRSFGNMILAFNSLKRVKILETKKTNKNSGKTGFFQPLFAVGLSPTQIAQN